MEDECGVVYYMKTIYKNCELEATRQWMQGDNPKGETAVFYGAFDLENGYEIVSAYGDYDTCGGAIRGMKEDVDRYRKNPSGWRDDE